jgi:hypothetical protein
MTPIVALSSPIVMAACIRAQNTGSMSRQHGFPFAARSISAMRRNSSSSLINFFASARYDQKGLTVKVLMRRSKAFCYATHIFPSGCFGGTRASRCAPSTSKITISPTRERRLQTRASCDSLIVFIERKQLAEKPHGLGEPATKEPYEGALASTRRPPTAKQKPDDAPLGIQTSSIAFPI